MQVSLRGISKRFGDVLANDSVDLELRPGETLALLGENGAGKSTIMKILYGFYRPDAGEIFLDGRPARIHSPRDAMALGIGMVFQQFSLVSALSVRENLMLALPGAPWWQGLRVRHWERALERLRRLAPDLDPALPVHALSVGERQLVELTKVLNLDAQVVILDEPTSVLTPMETVRLHQLIRELAGQGHAVVLITHKLADVAECADRVTVMRRGRVVAECEAAGKTPRELAALMVGCDPPEEAARLPAPKRPYPRLWLKGVSAEEGGSSVQELELEIPAGEILGVAGVAGNGQYALAQALAGHISLQSGEILLDGEVISRHEGRKSSDASIAYIPEQPAQNGVAADLDLTVNLALKEIRHMSFVPRWKQWRERAEVLLRDFDVRPPDPARKAGELSGGNLQKLVAARELSGSPALVVACYPSMGLDLAATQAVYAHLFRHAAMGACVVWISEDLDHLLRHAHRIAVLHHGRLAGVAEAATADREVLGMWMAGQAHAMQEAA